MHTFNAVKDPRKDGEGWVVVVDGWYTDEERYVYQCLRGDAKKKNSDCHRRISKWHNIQPVIPPRLNTLNQFVEPIVSKTYSLRIIVTIFMFNNNQNNETSKLLTHLFESLLTAEYNGDKVHIDLWIEEGKQKGVVDVDIIQICQSLKSKWTHGTINGPVITEINDIGPVNLWSTNEITNKNTNEKIVLLQENVEVSSFFWKWLKWCHHAYDDREDFAGCTLQQQTSTIQDFVGFNLPKMLPSGLTNGVNGVNGGLNVVSSNYFAPFVGTLGFSPSRNHWSKFSKWASDYLNTHVLQMIWKEYKKKNCPHPQCMWKILHLKYVSMHSDKYTVYNNKPKTESVASAFVTETIRKQNVHDHILHIKDTLIRTWSPELGTFQEKPTILGYDGNITTTAITHIYKEDTKKGPLRASAVATPSYVVKKAPPEPRLDTSDVTDAEIQNSRTTCHVGQLAFNDGDDEHIGSSTVFTCGRACLQRSWCHSFDWIDGNGRNEQCRLGRRADGLRLDGGTDGRRVCLLNRKCDAACMKKRTVGGQSVK